MAIGSCTSCSPVIDAVKLASNPAADLNGDGKVTNVELQTAALDTTQKAADAAKNTLKTDTGNGADTYTASRNASLLASDTLLLAQQS